MSASSDNDGVGYKRPPKATQFKPGRTGNPKGRPKTVPTFKTDLNDELSELITVRENGQECKITKRRAMVKALVAAAIKGDVRATNTIVALSTKFLAVTEDTTPVTDAPIADQDIIDAFVDRELKRRRTAATEPITPPDAKKGTH